MTNHDFLASICIVSLETEYEMDTGILLFVGIVALVIVVAVVVSAVTSVLSAVAGEVEDSED